MANYSLSINSTFQPFTYQELVAPVIHQQQVMDNLVEQYEKLSSQADVLEAMGANDRDKKSGSYSRYKAYSDSLRNEVDYLYQNGLDTTSRERLTNLRRRYNTEIVPIQNAWTKREQEVKDQMTASMANPSLMFTRNAKDTSLDQYLADPIGGYGVINGANITAQMSAMTKNLANKFRSGELERVDPATYNYIKKFGLDENMIRDWESYPTLKKMYEQVMQANGVTPEALKNSPNAASIINKAHSYAEMGMWNAMGKDETQIVENFDYRLAQQTAAEIAKANAKGGVGADAVNITSDGIGMESSENYEAAGLEELQKLFAPGSHDALRASYFGKNGTEVNAMKIYEEYQAAKKNLGGDAEGMNSYTNFNPGGAYMAPSGKETANYGTNSARENILRKYKKYGVTEILSDRQYNILKDMGYSDKNNPAGKGGRFSTILKGFNNLVVRNNRFSVNMTKYDSVDESIKGNILERGNYGLMGGMVWEVDKKGNEGEQVTDVKDFGFDPADSTKGTKVNGIYYDPRFKGRIMFRTTNGKRYVAAPEIIDGELGRIIKNMEADGRFLPQHIAAAIYSHLNAKNKVQSETDSNI